jgi:hypothetical protein
MTWARRSSAFVPPSRDYGAINRPPLQTYRFAAGEETGDAVALALADGLGGGGG